jgi:hypothetical protein
MAISSDEVTICGGLGHPCFTFIVTLLQFRYTQGSFFCGRPWKVISENGDWDHQEYSLRNDFALPCFCCASQ